MKSNILKHLLFIIAFILIVAACSEDESARRSSTCALKKLGMTSPNDYWMLEFNDNGSVASATSVYSGVENSRYEYNYESDKVLIYETSVSGSTSLAVEIGLDTKGRPVSNTRDGIVWERLIYAGDRLDHVMLATKDSLVYKYKDKDNNPDSLETYSYDADKNTWTSSNVYSYTYDQKYNPKKGLILPSTTGWTLDSFLLENNVTSFFTDTEIWSFAYSYDSDGYPISRTYTYSSLPDISETINYEYDCN